MLISSSGRSLSTMYPTEPDWSRASVSSCSPSTARTITVREARQVAVGDLLAMRWVLRIYRRERTDVNAPSLTDAVRPGPQPGAACPASGGDRGGLGNCGGLLSSYLGLA